MLKPVSVTPAPPRPFVAQTATAASPVTSAGFGAVLDAAQRAVVKTIAQPGGKAGLPNAAVSSGKPGEIPAATAGAVSQPVADPAEPEANGHPGRQTDWVVGQSGTKQAPSAAPHAVAPSASPKAAAAVVMPASFPEAAAVPSQAAALAAPGRECTLRRRRFAKRSRRRGLGQRLGRGLASPFLLTAPDRSRLNGKTPIRPRRSDSATTGQADTAVSEPDPAAAGQSMKSTAPGLVSGSQPTALVSPIYADAGREGGPVSPTDQQAIAAATTAVTAPLAVRPIQWRVCLRGRTLQPQSEPRRTKPGPVSGAKPRLRLGRQAGWPRPEQDDVCPGERYRRQSNRLIQRSRRGLRRANQVYRGTSVCNYRFGRQRGQHCGPANHRRHYPAGDCGRYAPAYDRDRRPSHRPIRQRDSFRDAGCRLTTRGTRQPARCRELRATLTVPGPPSRFPALRRRSRYPALSLRTLPDLRVCQPTPPTADRPVTRPPARSRGQVEPPRRSRRPSRDRTVRSHRPPGSRRRLPGRSPPMPARFLRSRPVPGRGCHGPRPEP